MAEGKEETKLPEEQIDSGSFVFPPRSMDQVFGSGTATKTEWPEVVGLLAEEAESIIKQDLPFAKVHVIPHDSFVTMDFRTDRVRLFVDSEQKIVRTPRTG